MSHHPQWCPNCRALTPTAGWCDVCLASVARDASELDAVLALDTPGERWCQSELGVWCRFVLKSTTEATSIHKGTQLHVSVCGRWARFEDTYWHDVPPQGETICAACLGVP